MAITLGNSAKAGAASPATTAAIDTSGGSLLIIGSACGSSLTPVSSDSKVNVWSSLTSRAPGGSEPAARIDYVTNPTVGTGHTGTVTESAASHYFVFVAFNGVKTTSPFDLETGTTINATTIQPGTLTPSENNCLIVTVCSFSVNETLAIDSGFTIVLQNPYNAGVSGGVALAYKVQTTAAAVNPTWSSTSASWRGATIASFKSAGATANSTWLWKA